MRVKDVATLVERDGAPGMTPGALADGIRLASLPCVGSGLFALRFAASRARAKGRSSALRAF
jgi:hypothetical protein